MAISLHLRLLLMNKLLSEHRDSGPETIDRTSIHLIWKQVKKIGGSEAILQLTTTCLLCCTSRLPRVHVVHGLK